MTATEYRKFTVEPEKKGKCFSKHACIYDISDNNRLNEFIAEQKDNIN